MCQLDRLRQLKIEIYQIAQQHHASRVYVFGSCARREETPESDIDFLAEFNDNASLFDQIGMQQALAAEMQSRCDPLYFAGRLRFRTGSGKRFDRVIS